MLAEPRRFVIPKLSPTANLLDQLITPWKLVSMDFSAGRVGQLLAVSKWNRKCAGAWKLSLEIMLHRLHLIESKEKKVRGYP